jgi:hypothetical protein
MGIFSNRAARTLITIAARPASTGRRGDGGLALDASGTSPCPRPLGIGSTARCPAPACGTPPPGYPNRKGPAMPTCTSRNGPNEERTSHPLRLAYAGRRQRAARARSPPRASSRCVRGDVNQHHSNYVFIEVRAKPLKPRELPNLLRELELEFTPFSDATPKTCAWFPRSAPSARLPEAQAPRQPFSPIPCDSKDTAGTSESARIPQQ